MSIGERILLAFSSPVGSEVRDPGSVAVDPDSALRLLQRVFPRFPELVRNRRVADFGCGVGRQGIALVQRYGCSVVGIDSNPEMLAAAARSARHHRIPASALTLVESISDDMRGAFEVVISQNSFEHFAAPEAALAEMASLLAESGVILMTFGPPWLAPYGSHMHFFCRIPWLNLLFREADVMKARSHYRDDGALRYEDVESGLNKMTLRRFDSILSSSGLRVRYRHHECASAATAVARVPLLREFVVNRVTVVLSAEEPPAAHPLAPPPRHPLC